MAKRRKSSLASALGAAGTKACQAHRDDETTFSGGADLPGGINAGIAELRDLRFGQYKTGENEGKYFFFGAGIVKQPTEINGVPIQGLRTQIMEPMCNTPNASGKRKTLDEHTAWVFNELRKLGANTDEVDNPDDLEVVAAILMEERPHFRFRTWQGDKQTTGPYAGREPRVNHDWRGACDYEDDEESEVDLVDKTGGPEEGDAGDAGEGSPDELTAFGELADESDEDADSLDAQRELDKRAEAIGLVSDNYDTWEDVATAIKEYVSEDEEEDEEEDEGEEEEEEEEEWEPAKEDLCYFRKTARSKKVEVQVTALFARKQTCNIKSLDDGKAFKDVPFDKLSKE